MKQPKAIVNKTIIEHPSIEPSRPLTTSLPIAYPWISVDGEFDESIFERAGIREALKAASVALQGDRRPLNGRHHFVISVSDEWLMKHKSRFQPHDLRQALQSPDSAAVSNMPIRVTLASLVQVLSDIRSERLAAGAPGQISRSQQRRNKDRRTHRSANNIARGNV